MVLGNYNEAVESAAYAVKLSPLDPMRYGPEGVLAVSNYNLRRYGDAEDAARRAIHSNPGFIHGYAVLAASCVRLGRLEEGQETIRRARAVEPKFRAAVYRSAPIGPPEQMEEFISALREAGLPE